MARTLIFVPGAGNRGAGAVSTANLTPSAGRPKVPAMQRDEDYMALALVQAEAAAAAAEVPVGAVLVDGASGAVLAQDHNRVEALHDPTAHAELLVIQAATRRLGLKRLTAAVLYVTLEPCPMCAQAIAFARLERLVFGASDPKGGGVVSGPRLFEQPTCHHRLAVTGGLQAEAAGRLLKDFFRARR